MAILYHISGTVVQSLVSYFDTCHTHESSPLSSMLISWLFTATLTAGATVLLNETDIVVQEGDSNTTVDICVVLEDDMGGLERDIVLNLMTVPETANGMPYMYAVMHELKEHISSNR